MSSTTCKELIALCKQYKIKGYSGKTKPQLIEMLEAFQTSSPSTNQPSLVPTPPVLVQQFSKYVRTRFLSRH